MNSPSTVIFFDGASKGNPGTSGAGGLIISTNKKTESSFSWGLGTMLNNQAESYSLLMASQIAKTKGFKSIQIFNDSEMPIKTLHLADCFNNSALNRTLQRIRNTLKEFDKVASFHIL